MKLENLQINNFRRFKELTVNFHPKLTVVVARNGQGKTSVLDAASIAIGTFVGAFDLGKSKHIEVQDARYHRLANRSENEQVFPVELEISIDNIEGKIIRKLNGYKSKTTIKDAAPLTDYGKRLMQQVRDLEEVTLPLMAYYSSGRLWHSHKNMSRKSILSQSRTMGYEDCFTSASSFTQVQQWMSKASYAVIQQKSMYSYNNYPLEEQIAGIQETVDSVLREQGWSNFHYSMQHEELAMTHEQFGVLPIRMLSDGVRAMVSMIADMAWRCSKLNPHLGKEAQQLSEGIVFIDEVDMHLHPQWQQTVIDSLINAFPCVQFIVTTHSPQVLSTVSSDNIRIIQNDINDSISTALPAQIQSRGVASADVMANIQSVDPVPNVEEAKWLVEYKTLVDQGIQDNDEGKQLKEKILSHFGQQHHEWVECERMIRLQAMKAKLSTLKAAKN